MFNSKKEISNENIEKISVPITLISAKLSGYPQFLYTLFYFFAAYLVLPIIDIPLIGLSVSAPIMFVVAIPCLFNSKKTWFYEYRRWIFFAVFIWIGIFLSTTLNGILSFGTNFDSGGAATLIQYAYWLLVFVIVIYFISQGSIMNKVASVLGWSVLLLATLRLIEALFFGRYGVWSSTRIMAQNDYGFQFSTFSPFLLVMIIKQSGWKRFLSIIANLLLWGAVAINGSRGSWISIILGVGIALIMFFISKPRKFFSLFLMILLVITTGFIAVRTLPAMFDAVQQRFNSFQSLEEDKSVLIRELMIQKGIKLFKESPLIGVGGNRFRQTSASLEIPFGLSYEDETYFNRRSSHNSYVEFLAEFGLVGVIPAGILLLSLVFKGFSTTMHALNINDVIPLAVFLSFIQMSVHMWAISALANTATWFIYGLVGAIIMTAHSQKEAQCA